MEIKIETLYNLSGLRFEDIELICLGLDELKNMDVNNIRVQEIIKFLENSLNPT